MTVGFELQRLTGFRLLHNHLSLELVYQFFDFGTPHFNALDKKIRFDIFEEIAKSDIEGLIFTMVWAFNEPEDESYINEIIEIFKPRNPKVCIVELSCELEERLIRNKHDLRLLHKPSKRDVEASDKRLLYHDKEYRMNSLEGEYPEKKILVVENTQLPAKAAALKIIEHFQL